MLSLHKSNTQLKMGSPCSLCIIIQTVVEEGASDMKVKIYRAVWFPLLRKEAMVFVFLRQLEKGWKSQCSAIWKCCKSLRAGCSPVLWRPFKQFGWCSKWWRATYICITDLVSLQAAHRFPDNIDGIDNGASFRLGLLSLLPCMTRLWFGL